MYTDHTVCLAILNTPKQSGKLARWALTVQEMDLTIRHKSGKKNVNADVLSRSPPVVSQGGQVCAIRERPSFDPSLPDHDEICRLQKENGEYSNKILYLTSGALPDERCASRKIDLESKQFQLIDGVLYHENSVIPDQSCVAVPKSLHN